jgi:hypothetical protein
VSGRHDDHGSLISGRYKRRPTTLACRRISEPICAMHRHASSIRNATLSAPFWIGSRRASCAFGYRANKYIASARRLADQKRSVELTHALRNPIVVLFRLVEKERPAVLRQRWRRSLRPKPARCLGFEPRSEVPKLTMPRARFVSPARLGGRRVLRGVCRTSRRPSSTKSLSSRPRNAASTLSWPNRRAS